MTQHKTRANWFTEVVSITIEYFPDRETALAYEKEAIIKEHPLYNNQHGTYIGNSNSARQLGKFPAWERTRLLQLIKLPASASDSIASIMVLLVLAAKKGTVKCYRRVLCPTFSEYIIGRAITKLQQEAFIELVSNDELRILPGLAGVHDNETSVGVVNV